MANGKWEMANSELGIANREGSGLEQIVEAPRLAQGEYQIPQQGEYGTSHVVRGHLNLEHYENIVFTAYRPSQASDVLTERMVGSGIAVKDGHAAFWFDVGNFKTPWQDEEIVMLIVEAVKQGSGYFTILRVEMNAQVDIQEIGVIHLEPMPVPIIDDGLARWQAAENQDVIGYSIYMDNEITHADFLTEQSYPTTEHIVVKPVIRCGYETVHGSHTKQGGNNTMVPQSYGLIASPNPFTKRIDIHYTLPTSSEVEIAIHDVSGRRIKTLMSGICTPGYYQNQWSGSDELGRVVSAGVYFVSFESEGYQKVNKVILLR
jgi:hypothetical protein